MLEPKIGTQSHLKHEVTSKDAPCFNGELVHEVYSTSAAVRDMEHAARLCLLPLLEPNEFGVGREVRIRHLRPVRFGETIDIISSITGFTSNTLTCEVISRHGDKIIADGMVVQGILPGSGLVTD